MALRFADIYTGELEQIRKRRLHQWYANQGIVGIPTQEQKQGKGPSKKDLDWIQNDPPEVVDPLDDNVSTPLVFNKMLEHLRETGGRGRSGGITNKTTGQDRGTPGEDGPQTPEAQQDSSGSEPIEFHRGLVGLALSGGGVRSAAFCLGTIQALARWGVFQKVDYLSTVSGGGFIGSCLSSLYAQGKPEFPFMHDRGVPENAPMRHLRNYSNYLAPRGFMDYLKVPGLLLRGILANLVIIMPYIILAAIITVFLAGTTIRNAVYAHLSLSAESVSATDLSPINIWDEYFIYTYWLISLFAVVIFVYPMFQAAGNKFGLSDWRRRNRGNRILAILIGVIAIVAVVEIQPIAVYYFTRVWFASKTAAELPLLDTFTGTLTVLAGFLAAISGRIAKRANKLAGTILLVGIGLLGPLVFWLIYLTLTRWGICGPPEWTLPFAEFFSAANWPQSGALCTEPPAGEGLGKGSLAVMIAFGAIASTILFYGLFFVDVNRTSLHGYYRDRLSKAFLFIWQSKDGKANERREELVHNDRQLLHELRGRPRGLGWLRRLAGLGRAILSKNWLKMLKAETWTGIGELFRRTVDQPTDGLFVAPYHLINAAINIQRPRTHPETIGQSSSRPNTLSHDLRGRKADYFLFSQLYVGSRLTGYCRSEEMYEADRHLDLGTAMAISGAAAAPNMGTHTIKPLVFIMTMLNVRLGYWLPNPHFVHLRNHPDDRNDGVAIDDAGLKYKVYKTLRRWKNTARLARRVGPLYLLLEMFGSLNEDWGFINVSDGGHIENLGLYPLLQRRCRLIIAVDGERDPKEDGRHKFSALASAIRHARIDEGIDIDIDLSQIDRKGGKHFAVGKIDYGPKFPPGWLVYIKSSLTQDENPYIQEYHLKNPDFPHESTGDQFFNETQFECYRALGYHAAQDFLERSGSDISSDRNLRDLFKRNKPKTGPRGAPRPVKRTSTS